MKIRAKLLTFLYLIILSFMATFLLHRNMGQKRLSILFNERKNEENKIFDRILELKEASLGTLAFDYTYWDEMADFIVTGNKEWVEKTIDKSVLNNYHANAIWIYKTDLSLAYSISNVENVDLKDMPLPKEAIKKIFLQDRFCHFFLLTPLGPMEIRGATVHPTIDVERKTAPYGYFFAGRLWNHTYIDELSKLTGSTITMSPFTREDLLEKINLQEGIIAFSRILNGWDKEPLMRLNVKIEAKSIKYFSQTAYKEPLLFIIFSVAILIYISIFMMHWIMRPLWLISSALNKGDTAYLNNLQKDKAEFGEVSRLIQKFFAQKDLLTQEIFQRKQTEEALQISEEKYRGLYDSIKDGIAMVDMQGNILECNQAYLDMLGYTKEEITKLTFLELTPQKWHKMNSDIIENKILKTGYSDEFEKEYIRKDGTAFPIVVRAWLIKDEQGKPKGMWAIARDITERKQKEEELRIVYEKLKNTESQLIQAAKMVGIGQLAAGVAHEINNPLTGVLNNVQFIKEELEKRKELSKDEFKEILNVIEESALRCKKTVRALLDFSRASRGPFQFISLNDIVEKVIALKENELGLKNILIKKQLQPNLSPVFGDSQLLQQIIFDMISNAQWAIQEKSKEEGGLITIKTQSEPEKNRVCLFICDTGLGIPKENIERIFEPFFTTKPQGQGTGLGLCMVYNIVKQHNGSIEVESQVNKGATFKVSLPCVPEKEKA